MATCWKCWGKFEVVRKKCIVVFNRGFIPKKLIATNCILKKKKIRCIDCIFCDSSGRSNSKAAESLISPNCKLFLKNARASIKRCTSIFFIPKKAQQKKLAHILRKPNMKEQYCEVSGISPNLYRESIILPYFFIHPNFDFHE
jgi:hypothetical protein